MRPMRNMSALAYLGRYDEAVRIHEIRVEDGYRGRLTVARG
jgi:hypothetical protein